MQSDHCVHFRFDEFDEAIDEAIEDDIKEADGGGMFHIYSFSRISPSRLFPSPVLTLNELAHIQNNLLT